VSVDLTTGNPSVETGSDNATSSKGVSLVSGRELSLQRGAGEVSSDSRLFGAVDDIPFFVAPSETSLESNWATNGEQAVGSAVVIGSSKVWLDVFGGNGALQPSSNEIPVRPAPVVVEKDLEVVLRRA